MYIKHIWILIYSINSNFVKFMYNEPFFARSAVVGLTDSKSIFLFFETFFVYAAERQTLDPSIIVQKVFRVAMARLFIQRSLALSTLVK